MAMGGVLLGRTPVAVSVAVQKAVAVYVPHPRASFEFCGFFLNPVFAAKAANGRQRFKDEEVGF